MHGTQSIVWHHPYAIVPSTQHALVRPCPNPSVATCNLMGHHFQLPIQLKSAVALINPATAYLDAPQLQHLGSSSCHSPKDTASASIIGIPLQCHTCSFISHPIAGMVSSARGRAPKSYFLILRTQVWPSLTSAIGRKLHAP